VICIVPVIKLLETLGTGTDDNRAQVWQAAPVWSDRVPVLLSTPALVLAAAALAIRFLPGGRAAADRAPLFAWRRRADGGPPRARAGVVVVALLTLALVGGTEEPVAAIRAMAGQGELLTVGTDLTVDETSRHRRPPWSATTAYGQRVALHGGDAQQGERYRLADPYARHAYSTTASGRVAGVLDVLIPGTLAALALTALGFQLRRARRRDAWLAGPSAKPARSPQPVRDRQSTPAVPPSGRSTGGRVTTWHRRGVPSPTAYRRGAWTLGVLSTAAVLARQIVLAGGVTAWLGA
jgi:hypothetical protein